MLSPTNRNSAAAPPQSSTPNTLNWKEVRTAARVQLAILGDQQESEMTLRKLFDFSGERVSHPLKVHTKEQIQALNEEIDLLEAYNIDRFEKIIPLLHQWTQDHLTLIATIQTAGHNLRTNFR